ncbi:ketopantoate reductase family protein [Kitasatospora azatica]|uniref:ketopantoate reductase family protein n=1 Tax=Kitasatospora azatica TaxID=58347 RepID=UPI00055D5002|nr:2-dehydropantoate 2-reductase N-terminal domain-containing protein [Kitasatospora azatica]
MRYIIIGAGAVGGTIGGRLFQHGHEVVLVARGAHLAALCAGGLRLATPQGEYTLGVPVVGGPEELGELRADDVLVLAVKSQDTAGVLGDWALCPVAGGGVAADRLPVVCAQNGVENERVAQRIFRTVYGMCVWLPATHLEPGRVVAHTAPLSGILTLGRYPGGPLGRYHPGGCDLTVKQIGEDLSQSLFDAPVVEDVMRWKYGKLLNNLANALDALLGREELLSAEDLWRGVRAEGELVLEAAGIAYSTEDERAAVQRDRMDVQPIAGVARAGGSSWQSLARATGSIEADQLNGEIALLGRVHGVPTPLNDLLQRLVVRFAYERRAPGSMTADQLRALRTQ